LPIKRYPRFSEKGSENFNIIALAVLFLHARASSGIKAEVDHAKARVMRSEKGRFLRRGISGAYGFGQLDAFCGVSLTPFEEIECQRVLDAGDANTLAYRL
jgi:hypothetical protein